MQIMRTVIAFKSEAKILRNEEKGMDGAYMVHVSLILAAAINDCLSCSFLPAPCGYDDVRLYSDERHEDGNHQSVALLWLSPHSI